MWFDENTAEALNVRFHSVIHFPNLIFQLVPSKFSDNHTMSTQSTLFSIVNKLRSPVGKVMMKRWLLSPLTDIEMISARHEAVALFIQHENRDLVASSSDSLPFCQNSYFRVLGLQNFLSGVKDGRKVLNRILLHRESLNDWFLLPQTVANVLELQSVAESFRNPEVGIIHKVSSPLTFESILNSKRVDQRSVK